MYNEKKHIKLVLDIGSLFTKYIVLQSINGKEQFIDARILNTPQQLFGEEGEIVNSLKLESFLEGIVQNIRNKDKKYKKIDLVVSISLSYVENNTTHSSSSYFDNRDFAKDLKNQIKTSAQYDNSKFFFGYSFKNTFNTTGSCDTLVVGYDQKIINFYLKFFDNRGIFVQSITLGNLSIIESLPDTTEFDNSFEASYEVSYSLLVDLGASTTEVILLKNDFPVNYFVVNQGGNDITQKLQEHFTLTLEDAEQLKVSTNENDVIYLGELSNQVYTSDSVKEIVSILEPVFENWKNEIYQDINSELKLQKITEIDSVYFTGGSSYIKNFPMEIAKLFNAEMKELDYANMFDLEKVKQEIDIAYYNLNSFLPVLTHLKPTPINLISENYIKSKKTKLPNIKGGTGVLVVSLALFIGANSLGYLQTAQNNQSINEVNDRMDDLLVDYEAQQNKVKDYEKLDLQVKGFEDRISKKIKWSDLMRKIYDATPEGIQIVEVHEIGNGQIEIVGMSLDYQLVGIFGKLLQKDEETSALMDAEPMNITSETVKLTDDSDYEMRRFVIRGKIHPNNLIK